MKNSLLIAAVAAVSLCASASAEDLSGRDLAIQSFKALDTSDRGYIDMAQATTFGSDVFTSMDGDEDAKISRSEFLAWDYGMRVVAEQRDAVAAFETALRVVHAFWDRDGDGSVTRGEHRQSIIADFRRADVDDNGILSESEFVRGFSVLVAVRAALAPDLQ